MCNLPGEISVLVLGCWSPYPTAGGACSGYLVSDSSTKILLDCGNGVFGRLAGHMDFNSLDAVVITHLHPDHYLDLFCLRHAVEYAQKTGRRAGPLKLYLPAEPCEIFKELHSFEKAFETLKIEELGKHVRIGSLDINFFPVKHTTPAYAVSFVQSAVKDLAKKSLVFSGDTGYFEGLIDFISGAGLFLCEASGLDQDIDYLGEYHLTARQAGRLAASAGVSKLVLTHFFPEYDLDELYRQSAGGWSEIRRDEPNIEKAKEGRSFKVPSLGR